MNHYPFRAKSLAQRVADGKTKELETIDTALFACRSSRFNANLSRATVSLLALGLTTAFAVSAHADESTPVTKKPKSKAVKVTKTVKLPVLRTDIPHFSLITSASGQDTQPPTTPPVPTTPDATKPATPPTIAPTPAAATPAAPAPGSVAYSGLIDIYYGVNTRAPRSPFNAPFATTVTPDGTHLSADNAGRSFDVNDRDPSLSLAELNVVRTHNKSLPIDFTGTFTFGETARFVHATEPGGTGAWSFIQQLYVSYTPHILKRDVAVDFGQFVTPFGLEVIESVNNDNYSRGFNFQYGVPLYHDGLRATFPIDNKGALTFIGGIVNGWNNAADDNNGKSVFGQVTWKPSPKLTGIFGVMGGPEGTGAYGSAVIKQSGDINTDLYDAQAIYQLSAKTKLAANITYGAADGSASFVGLGNMHVSANWLGLAGYARHQFTPAIAGAIRVEQFEDNNGARTGTGVYTKLNEVTLTGEYATLHGHFVARLEYRHDHANQNTFFGAGVGGTAADQDTITASGVYKF